jgi:hypothetical protein
MNGALSLRTVLRHTFRAYVARAPLCLSAALSLSVLIKLDTALFNQAAAIGAGLINLLLLALFVCFVMLAADEAWDARPQRGASELVRSASSAVGRLLLVGVVAGLAISLVSSFGSALLLAMIFGAAFAAGANLATFVVIALLAVIALLIPQLYLMTNWSVCLPVVVLERPGGLRALRRSRELVRGNGSRVLGLILLLTLPLSLAAAAFANVTHSLGSAPTLAGELLLMTLIAPIPVLAVTALYYELRRIKQTPITAGFVPDAA